MPMPPDGADTAANDKLTESFQTDESTLDATALQRGAQGGGGGGGDAGGMACPS